VWFSADWSDRGQADWRVDSSHASLEDYRERQWRRRAKGEALVEARRAELGQQAPEDALVPARRVATAARLPSERDWRWSAKGNSVGICCAPSKSSSTSEEGRGNTAKAGRVDASCLALSAGGAYGGVCDVSAACSRPPLALSTSAYLWPRLGACGRDVKRASRTLRLAIPPPPRRIRRLTYRG
jgi:hypothetical protein